MLLFYPYLLRGLFFTLSDEEMLGWQERETHTYAGKR